MSARFQPQRGVGGKVREALRRLGRRGKCALGRRRSPVWTGGLLVLAAACGGGGSRDSADHQQGGDPPVVADFEVALSGSDRAGVGTPAGPVTLGLPLPAGELADAIPLEVELPGPLFLPAESRVLARHPDDSVRWLLVEFLAPARAPGAVFEGTLRPRQRNLTHSGSLSVIPAAGAEPLTVRNGLVIVRSASGPGELFALASTGPGGLAAPARFAFETATEILSTAGGGLEVESESLLAVTLVRRDDLADPTSGRLLARLTTRLTVWRGSAEIRVHHSLDVLRGPLAVRRWDLELPLDQPGAITRLVQPDGAIESVSGDFERRQVGHDTLRRDGVDEPGRLRGVAACAGTLVAARHFWQLFPSALRRDGDALVLELCPEVDGRLEALDRGFGRTQELWITVGDVADATDPAAAAARLDRPTSVHPTASWYCGAEAFGPLGEALPGDHPALEEKIAQATDLTLWARDLKPEWNYGIQNWGDFFDRENSISYWGAQQQEYDPAWVILQQFLRTGDPDYLQPGLELAWHFAEVDMADYGGCFQHRASQDHVESHIAGILAPSYRAEWEAWPYYDGTLENAIFWLGLASNPGMQARILAWMAPDRNRGMETDEELDLLFCLLGLNLLRNTASGIPQGSIRTIRDFAAWFSQQSAIQQRGYSDPDAQFADFFALHGGNWETFPSFHVDDLPLAFDRHQGSHALIQGVILAHLLTGEPRLREQILAFGRHLASEVVPIELANLIEQRDTSSDYLHPRALGWPLIGLLAVAEVCEGMNGEEAVAAEALAAAQDCVTVLIETPIERIESTIHAGVVLEGLVHWDRRTQDPVARAYLVDLARTWAAQHYDWNEHAFRYKSYGVTETYKGMTGLMILGLAYAESIAPDPDLRAVLLDAWDNMPQSASYAKAYAMLYRGAGRALSYLRDLLAPAP